MFELVADIEQYPSFLPWCVALRVVRRDVVNGADQMLADMVVAYKVFRERFRSEVTLHPERGEIDATYVDGPFERLITNWRFVDRAEGGCDIHFLIDFEFRGFILQTAAATVFEKAFMKMTDAFKERAETVYGAI